MSLGIDNLQIFEVIDPTLRLDNKRGFTVERGPEESYYYPFPCSSGSPSASVNTIIANPSSRGTILDRKVYLNAQFKVTLTSAGPSAGLGAGNASIYLNGGASAAGGAPRAYPISSSLANLQVNIGNDSVTTQLQTYFSAVQRFQDSLDLQHCELSTFPSQSDSNQMYGELANDGVNSPFNSYSDTQGAVITARGGFVLDSVTTTPGLNPKQSQDILVTITEPIFMSPLINHGNKSGFIGIEQFQIVTTFGSLSTRFWTAPAVGLLPNVCYVNGITVTPLKLSAYVRQLTPPINMSIPMPISYDYSTITPYVSSLVQRLVPLPANTHPMGTMFSSGSITVNTIPERIYVWVGNTQADLNNGTYFAPGSAQNTGWYLPDTFAEITNVTVQWNTRTLLSSATEQDLYEMSAKNGSDISFPQWCQYTGSVLCIQFPSDIGLSALDAPGVLSRNQLQITVGANNPSAVVNNSNGGDAGNVGTQFFNCVKNMSLYVAIVETGTLSILENGHVVKALGVLSQSDVLAAETKMERLPFNPNKNKYGGGKYGGNFFDDVWHGIKETGKFALNNLGPITTVASKLAGFGHSRKHSRKHSRRGSGLVGGRRLSRKHLK